MNKLQTIFIGLILLVSQHPSSAQGKIKISKQDTQATSTDTEGYYGPSGVVRMITQDKKGNIWFTSWQGVYKFDGKWFTNITKEQTSARFFSILQDRKGNWWFGSIGEG
ncbi:MAG: histidine kinase, partial [Flammeovirgaceae bacterium]|nr:histidine kinase [Flammeovirgaceae bacterium]